MLFCLSKDCLIVCLNLSHFTSSRLNLSYKEQYIDGKVEDC